MRYIMFCQNSFSASFIKVYQVLEKLKTFFIQYKGLNV